MPDSKTGQLLGASPEDLYADYLARVRAGEVVDFEAFCARHPEHAGALRALAKGDADVERVLQGARFVSSFHGLAAGASQGGAAGVADLRADDELGDYRLIERLGHGGQGQVWEAEQISLGRRVALKTVVPRSVDAHDIELIAREARAGGRLAHPGIVSIHAYGEVDGVYWIAQELVPGGVTLRHLIDKVRAEGMGDAPRYYRRVAEFVRRLAEALQAAHAAGVIHRDVKPQNILITAGDEPKLTDFGLARIADELALSRTGQFAGTPLYMSPEQVAARRMGLDHRTDVFSLGVVLYEMLALQRPFDGDSSHEIAEKIVTWDPQDLGSLRKLIPLDLAVICHKALEKRRGDRYQSMADLAEDLRRHLAHEPILARPPSRRERCWKWLQRHPVATAAMSGTALALGTILGLWLHASEGWREAARERDAAQHGAFVANLRAAAASIEDGQAGPARRFLDACPPDQRGWAWAHLDARISTGEVYQGSVGSPGGSAVVIRKSDQLVTCGTAETRVWDMRTGVLVSAFEPGLDKLELQASPDERFIVGNGGFFSVWDLVRRETWPQIEKPYRVGDVGMTKVAISADSRLLYVYQPSGIVEIWNLEQRRKEREAQVFERGSDGCIAMLLGPEGRLLMGTARGVVQVHDPTTLELLASWGRGGDEIFAAGLSGMAASCLLTVQPDGVLAAWRVATGEKITEIQLGAQPQAMRPLTNERGALVATLDNVMLVRLDGYPKVIVLAEGRVGRIAVSRSGELLAAALGTSVRLWTAGRESESVELLGCAGRIVSLDFSVDESQIVAVTDDGSVRSWEVSTGPSPVSSSYWGGTAHRLLLDPDGRFAVTSPFVSPWMAHVWDPWTLKRTREIRLPEDGPRFWPEWSASEGVIWARAGDNIYSWRPDSGDRVLEEGERWLGDLGVLPDGRKLAWRNAPPRGASPTLLLADSPDGPPIARLEGHEADVTSADLSADGRLLASGSRDRTVRIWELTRGTQVAVCRGPQGYVEDVAITPDGRRVAGSSFDGTLRLWNAKTGAELVHLEVPDEGVRQIAFSSDGRRLIGVTGHGGLVVWESDLRDARRVWDARASSLHRERQLDAFFGEDGTLEDVEAMIQAKTELPSDEKDELLKLARHRTALGAQELNRLAWSEVDPDSPRLFRNTTRALWAARRAVAKEPDHRAFHDTLAWALFANHRGLEALGALQSAARLADVHEWVEYQGHLNRLKEMVQQRLSPGFPDQ